MARKRQLKGRPEANRLAAFVCRITDPRTIDQVLALVPGASKGNSTWAKYMNGTEVIPKKDLGALIQALSTGKPAQLRAYTVEANELWKAAHAESLRPAGPESATVEGRGRAAEGAALTLVQVQGELIEALKGQHKAVKAADKANAMISSLLQMGALLDTVIAGQETRLRSVAVRERAEAELQLSQARLRLERTAAELAKANGRRYTAEQAQRALAHEVWEARQQVARLQQRMEDVIAVEPPVVAALPPVPDVLMEEFDDALAGLIEEGAEADQEIADLAAQAHLRQEETPAGPTLIEGTVITGLVRTEQQRTDRPSLSWTTPDNAVTGGERDQPENTAGFQGTTSSLVAGLAEVQDATGFAHQLRALRFRSGAHNWPLDKIATMVLGDVGLTVDIATWFSGRTLPPDGPLTRSLVLAMGATAGEAQAFEDAHGRIAERVREEAGTGPAPTPGTPRPHLLQRPPIQRLGAINYASMLAASASAAVTASAITVQAQIQGPTWVNFWLALFLAAVLGTVWVIWPTTTGAAARRWRAVVALALLAGIILPVATGTDLFGARWIEAYTQG
ncbi:hypothetical protein ACIBEA_41190 [Streptomyces sp. NPDC051555]|uniref:hypothetical protein n=1 Tax=Streptomyces sp. NPDC051555 TaxID=3365657 RepID=UPI003793C8FA